MTEQAQSPARCDAVADGAGEPLCDGERVRHVVFRAPGVTAMDWQHANWCEEHRKTAIADGYLTWTWLTHIATECRFCHRPFHPTQEAVDATRELEGSESSDDQIGASLDVCAECSEGEPIPGERPEPADPRSWQIPSLTARDVLALEAALEVAADPSEEEPWPGLFAVQKKVARAADAVRASGFTVAPETSAQAQARIDGETPWNYDTPATPERWPMLQLFHKTTGVRVKGTDETVGCTSFVAGWVRDDTGALIPEYDGDTEYFYDSSTTTEDEHGNIMVVLENGETVSITECKPRGEPDEDEDKWLDAVVTPTEPKSGD